MRELMTPDSLHSAWLLAIFEIARWKQLGLPKHMHLFRSISEARRVLDN
jgi:hypothetical protein